MGYELTLHAACLSRQGSFGYKLSTSNSSTKNTVATGFHSKNMKNRKCRPLAVSIKRSLVSSAVLLSIALLTNPAAADSSTSVTSIHGGATWVKNADNDFNYNNSGTSAGRKALLYSTESYSSEDGFKLTFYYKTGSIDTTGSHRFSVGLLSDDTDLASYSGANPFGNDGSAYGVGVNITNNNGNRGMNFANGSVVVPLDESGTRVQFSTDALTKVTMEIGIGGFWSYRINDEYEASGVIADGIDLSKNYHIAVFGQDDNGVSKRITSIKLDKRYAAGERAKDIRGTWYSGIAAPLRHQLYELDFKTLDGFGASFTGGATASAFHKAPSKLLESFSEGEGEVPAWGDLSLDEPENDEFLAAILDVKNAGFKVKGYANSEGLVGSNQAYLEGFVQNFKDWCDTDPEAVAYINSQPFHTGIWNGSGYEDASDIYPNRKYMFCYAEFVLKDYSLRYGEYFSSWIFDDGGTMVQNGDNDATGVVEQQRIYQAYANAVHAGNPEIPIAFNNGRSTVNYPAYPFAQPTRFDDFTFGHAFGGNGDHASKTGTQFNSNYKNIARIAETNGYVHDGGAWTWDDKIVGNFHSKLPTSGWKYGIYQAWEQDDFNQWNLESMSNGGMMTWDGAYDRPETNIRSWALIQLKALDDFLYANGVSINGRVESVSISSEDLFVEFGTTQQFYAELTPSDADNQTVTWHTTDPDVFTVDSDGLVTAVGVGKANLKVRADNGRLSEVKTVRVYKPVDVTALSITSEDGFVMLGETQQFYADVTPSNADNPAVTWHTTDSDVFTIDDNGVLTPVGVGKANVKVRWAEDDSVQAIKTVRITAPVPVTALSVTSEDGFVMLGETQQFYADATPTNATNPAVTWHTTNPDVFTVDNNGVLTPVSVGKANVKARWAENDMVQAIKTVRITAPVPVTGLTVSSEDGTVLLGETQQFFANILPTNATNQSVTWHTTDRNVFTVDANGVLTPVGVGKANVKVRWAENSNMAATMTVRVR